jgi:hypothetical protein
MAVTAYPDRARNEIYNMLFADDPEVFKAAEQGDPAEVAADDSAESRVRAVAFRRLKQSGTSSPLEPPPLLGVVVEIALDEGLDTLAAYADGRVRYINHAGGMTIVEEGNLLAAQVEALMLAAQPVVNAIGPWTGERQPPPPTGQARLTFLVGGELYLGQGPFGALAGDAMAGPVLTAATTLLMAVTALPQGGSKPGA